jgi:16S rRNA (uracil1498-N3)-methyltransferase
VYRFYIPTPLKIHEKVILDKAEAHHATKVLRLSPGESIMLVNGTGSSARAIIETAHKNALTAVVTTVNHVAAPSAPLTLIVPIMRPSKLEWVVEKGTELGVDAWRFFAAEQGEKESLSAHQIERLRLITVSALKQCGRLYLPPIAIYPTLADTASVSTIWYGDVGLQKQSLMRSKTEPLFFVTGPESGYSDTERTWLGSRGTPFCLSENTLRAETAPIAAAAILAMR